MFNLSNNEISILEDKCDIEELDNKTFEKVSESYNIGISKYYDRERSILILNKKKKKIKKIYFSNNKLNKIRLFEKDEILSDSSNISIDIKLLDNYQINNNIILESRLNSIKKNIEDVNFNKFNMTYRNNKNSNNNSEFFDENNNTNLIEEIKEDDEEKYDNNDMNNRTVPINSNHIKHNISIDKGYSQYINNTNLKDNYSKRINKPLLINRSS